MCRLLGVIANMEVSFHFSLRRFGKLGKQNPDGWGIGWYKNGKALIYKEPLQIGVNGSKFEDRRKDVYSSIMVSHVRKATCGTRSIENSHPFQYLNWIFAHNGQVDRDVLLESLDDRFIDSVQGETDSEVYFYWVLQCIEENGDAVKGVRKAVEYVIRNAKNVTGLNFVMSDGTNLYAFRGALKYRDLYSLYWVKRDPETSWPLELDSDETGLTLHKKAGRGEKAV